MYNLYNLYLFLSIQQSISNLLTLFSLLLTPRYNFLEMRKENIPKIFHFMLSVMILILVITTSTWYPTDAIDSVHQFTRSFEFDYISWEINAGWKKISLFSLGPTHHLSDFQQRIIVSDYFKLLNSSNELQRKITKTYSDPQISSPEKEALQLEKELNKIAHLLNLQQHIAESVLQYQIGRAINSLGITDIKTPFPPILFQTTKLPKHLIISPRDVIIQEKSVSLSADIAINEIIKLENDVEENLNYSALVVPVGGVSTYPTMVINTTDIKYLIETVAHEWTHNYLSLRPLGIRYTSSPELRIMNETAASIAGSEISQVVIEIFYPDLIEIIPILPRTFQTSFPTIKPFQLQSFNFSKEMYQTRIKVDDLLTVGKIDEAEQFMESQRLYFWENGYQIRKLNQAYFAFHGAYADEPFSAAGRDPVGDDVRLFRGRQTSLASFIRKISWMYNYSQLKIASRVF